MSFPELFKNKNKDKCTEFALLFEEQIKPFKIIEHDNYYSVILDQSDYQYNWLSEVIEQSYYGDGHCYNDLFNDYLSSNFSKLNKKLNYDSENGMFCVYCKNLFDAEEVAYELSKLYKNENKMIEWIKNSKEKYDYSFDIKI